MDVFFFYFIIAIAGLILLVTIARQPYMGIVFMVCMLPLESFAVLPGILHNFTSLTSLFGLAALFFSFARNKRFLSDARITDKSIYVFTVFLLVLIMIGDLLKPVSTGFTYPFTYLQLLILMWLSEQIFIIPEQIETLMKYYIFTNLLAASVSALFFLPEVVSSLGDVNRLAGWQGNANEFAVYLSVAIVMTFYYLMITPKKAMRVLLVLVLAVLAYFILLSGSRGAALFLALVFGWLFLQFRRNNIVLIVFSLVILFVIFAVLAPYLPSAYFHRLANIPQTIIYGEDTVGLRQMLWNYGLELWSNQPILGIGSGVFVAYSIRQFPFLPHALPLHNTYLTWLVENGVVGLFLFLAILVKSFVNYSSAIRSAGRNSRLGLLAIIWQAVMLVILLNGIKGDWNNNKMLWLAFSFSMIITVLQKAVANVHVEPVTAGKLSRLGRPYYRIR